VVPVFIIEYLFYTDAIALISTADNRGGLPGTTMQKSNGLWQKLSVWKECQ
jgi:hypothetical protein